MVFAFGQTDFNTECDFCFQVANLKNEYSVDFSCALKMLSPFFCVFLLFLALRDCFFTDLIWLCIIDHKPKVN